MKKIIFLALTTLFFSSQNYWKV